VGGEILSKKETQAKDKNRNTKDKQQMKRKIQIITIASAASFLAFTALAQETTNAKTDAEFSARRFPRAPHLERLGRAEKASHIIGLEVKDYQNEKLGKVNDLALDLETGRIVQVILSIGGFFGIGDTLMAVPPGALHYDAADKVIHLNADKEKLKAAPQFEMSKWAEGSDSNHVVEIYRYYGEEPYFAATNQRVASNSSMTLGYVQKASKLTGLSVKNLQDEQLGKVESLMVDLPAGRVLAVIVSSGGFLGMENELSVIPPTALRLNSERDSLQLDVSKEALSNAPHFQANQWPDIGQPSYAQGVYRAYRVEPYFSTNTVTASGNTAANVRERPRKTLTTLDQGNSTADRDRTARIRKEIVGSKGMSLNGRNVKIITIDGQVTLRGPVNTEEEKRLIGEIVARIAQPENVNNQLEVDLTRTGRN
jgi:sporulation protein YlmC with PRC-barrel domain